MGDHYIWNLVGRLAWGTGEPGQLAGVRTTGPGPFWSQDMAESVEATDPSSPANCQRAMLEMHPASKNPRFTWFG